MTTEAPEQTATPVRCECGDELPIAAFPKCFECMTDDEAQAIANLFNQQAIAVMRGRDRAVAVIGFHAAAAQAQDTLDAELGQAAGLEAALSAATAA